MCVGVIYQKIHKIGVDTIDYFFDTFVRLDGYEFSKLDLIDELKSKNINNRQLRKLEKKLDKNIKLDTFDNIRIQCLIDYYCQGIKNYVFIFKLPRQFQIINKGIKIDNDLLLRVMQKYITNLGFKCR